jgi:RNA polymerase sigma factor (TIGR02999 family)
MPAFGAGPTSPKSAVCAIKLNNGSRLKKGEFVASSGEITRLLTKLKGGNRQAESELVPLIYAELRRLARGYMRRERPDHTLQPTALVHEAYLRLMEESAVDWQSRAHFFAVAAQLMRRILVDHARAHQAAKRGGRGPKTPLDEGLVFSKEKSGDLLALDEGLARLAELDPRQSRIVELRYFGGLSVEETAQVLSISVRTVKRDWAVARAWLYQEICKAGAR